MDKQRTDVLRELFLDRFPDPASMAAAFGCPPTRARYETAWTTLDWLSRAADAEILRQHLARTAQHPTRPPSRDAKLDTVFTLGLTLQSHDELGLPSAPSCRKAEFREGVTAIWDTASGLLRQIDVVLLGGMATLTWTTERSDTPVSLPPTVTLVCSTNRYTANDVLTIVLDSLQKDGSEVQVFVSFPVIVSFVRWKSGASLHE